MNYVTPVDGVKEVLAKKDPKLANNQLIFPDEQFTADCTPQAMPGPLVRGRGHREVPVGGHGLTKAGAAADRSPEE